jgi:hypothetical protein
MAGMCRPISNKGENEMIGRKVVVLSLLSVLLFSVFAAQSASAAVTTSKNIEAFTCRENGGVNDFDKRHCDPSDFVGQGNGQFGHVKINLGQTSEVDATNEKVKNATSESEPAVLKGEVLLVKTEISCTKVKNNLAKSSLTNSEPAAGQHTLSGAASAEYSTCTVLKPAKCTVKEPIVANATVHAVEGLEGPKAEKNAMGLEFIGSGASETFTEIEYLNKGAEACSLNKKVFPVKGKAYGTGGPTFESSQENKESGSTLVFTPKFKMEELILGEKPAEYTSIVTPRMGEAGNPITTTTVT